MSIFSNRFFAIINEQDELPPGSDQENLGTEPTTPEGSFDEPGSPIATLQKQQNIKFIRNY